MRYLLLILSWVLFYFTHTYFARLKLKRKFQQHMGKAYNWYRFFYTTASTVIFLGIFVYSATIPPLWLLSQEGFMQYLGLMAAGIGTIILIKSFKHFPMLKFIGIPPHNDLKEENKLVVKGIHQHLRHPIYLGLIFIFMGFFLFTPNLTSLIHFLALVVYLPFGIYYEEKKLIAIFGAEYIKYKEEVPALIPRFRL
jgi:methanethiol S-methyltransferase